MKALKQAALAAALGAQKLGLLDLLEQSGGGRPGLLHVLMYHRVAEPQSDPQLLPGLISATPEGFARQMHALSRRHHVVSLEEVLEAARTLRPLPPRAVLITFDDAYDDFLTHAWPILEAKRLPATLFVPTGFPGDRTRSFWWDRLYQAVVEARDPDALRRFDRGPALETDERASSAARLRTHVKALPHDEGMAFVDRVCEELGAGPSPHRVLGWSELRALARAGVTLCPHTRNHPLLDRLPVEEIRREVEGSRDDLEREIGAVLPAFAYPSGAHDEAAVLAVEEAGFELAFTTGRGVVDLARDAPLRLRRIPVVQRLSDPALRIQLLPHFARLNPLWASSGSTSR